MTIPIQLESISKCYRIFQNPQDRFKQALLDRFHKTLGKKAANPLYREHWALRDVSFKMQPGEAVGILGRNGAGKSTLLQIIAGTLEPTAGSVKTSGRITALLELGSGFNPEFTGRENVFLNAQILGLSLEDTLARFDEIASFADIGDFIDQPVKTYSSGMMMRLAFAVQTAVNPKVLIIDEALSVGDMFFQAKCMARINKLVNDGVALLFVSHDTGVVRQLCQRALLLDGGTVRAIGAAASVADQYVKLQLEDRNQAATTSTASIDLDKKVIRTIGETESVADQSVKHKNQSASPHPVSVKSHLLNKSENIVSLNSPKESEAPDAEDIFFGQEAFKHRAQHHRVNNSDAEIINVQMLRQGVHAADYDFNEEALIRILVRFDKSLSNLNISLKIRTLQGIDVAFFDTRLQDEMGRHYENGKFYLFEWKIKLPLLHGNYALACGLAHPPAEPGADWQFVDIVSHAYEFRMAPRQQGMIDGFVTLPANLAINKISLDLA